MLKIMQASFSQNWDKHQNNSEKINTRPIPSFSKKSRGVANVAFGLFGCTTVSAVAAVNIVFVIIPAVN